MHSSMDSFVMACFKVIFLEQNWIFFQVKEMMAVEKAIIIGSETIG